MYLTRITLSILLNMNFSITIKNIDWYINSTTAQGPHDCARCVCQKCVDWLRQSPDLLLVSWTILLNTSNDNVIQTRYRPKFSLPSENLWDEIEMHWRTEVIFVIPALYMSISDFTGYSMIWFMKDMKNMSCQSEFRQVYDTMISLHSDGSSTYIERCDMAFIVPMHHNKPNITYSHTSGLYLCCHKLRQTAFLPVLAMSSSHINCAESGLRDQQYTQNNVQVLWSVSSKTHIQPPVKWFAPYWEKTKCNWSD